MPLRGLQKWAPQWLRRQASLWRKRRVLDELQKTPPVAASRLAQTIRDLGFRPGSILMVHSSMAALRPIEGGGNAVLRALLDVVDETGTLCMPTFPFTGRVTEYAATDPVFDARRTPSRMGLLTEMFRRHSGVVRSAHPTHPVAALGARAAWLVAGHEESPTPFGPETPFGRLYASDGQVLLLGVGLESMTLVHVVEDLMGARFPVAVYEEEPARLQVIPGDGGPKRVSVRLHAAAVSARRDSSVLLRPLLERGIARRCTLAGTEVMLVEARGLVEMLRIEAQEGRTIYGGL